MRNSTEEVMMRSVAIAFLSVSVLLFSVLAYGQAIEYFTVQLDGIGGMMLDGADYSGAVSLQMAGTWTLDVDDSLWPDESDSTARFDYIWDTFFAANYDGTPGQQSWRGYFDGATLPSVPKLTLDTTYPGGVLVSNASFVVLVRDYYGDGELSQIEKHHACQVSMTISVETPLCTGYFVDYCGDGSLGAGNFNFINPPDPDEITFFGQVQVWFCGAPVEDSTWGSIKALYQ